MPKRVASFRGLTTHSILHLSIHIISIIELHHCVIKYAFSCVTLLPMIHLAGHGLGHISICTAIALMQSEVQRIFFFWLNFRYSSRDKPFLAAWKWFQHGNAIINVLQWMTCEFHEINPFDTTNWSQFCECLSLVCVRIVFNCRALRSINNGVLWNLDSDDYIE